MICYFILNLIAQPLPLNSVENGKVALTIDEGPSVYTSHILDILQEEGIKATFHINTAFEETNSTVFMKDY